MLFSGARVFLAATAANNPWRWGTAFSAKNLSVMPHSSVVS